MGKARRKVEKLVFASAHAIVDPSSGAAVATNEAMQLLAQSRFQCQAFNAAMLDFPEEVCVEELLAKLGLPVRGSQRGGGSRDGADPADPLAEPARHDLPQPFHAVRARRA